MNRFNIATQRLVSKHSVKCKYVVCNNSAYNTETSAVTSTEVQKDIDAYPKQISAGQYNFPKLIGKEAIMFYILPGSQIPRMDDKIIYEEKTYLVDSYQEHSAEGSVLLYKVIGVRV